MSTLQAAFASGVQSIQAIIDGAALTTHGHSILRLAMVVARCVGFAQGNQGEMRISVYTRPPSRGRNIGRLEAGYRSCLVPGADERCPPYLLRPPHHAPLFTSRTSFIRVTTCEARVVEMRPLKPRAPRELCN
jgi:hypothetical protein